MIDADWPPLGEELKGDRRRPFKTVHSNKPYMSIKGDKYYQNVLKIEEIMEDYVL